MFLYKHPYKNQQNQTCNQTCTGQHRGQHKVSCTCLLTVWMFVDFILLRKPSKSSLTFTLLKLAHTLHKIWLSIFFHQTPSFSRPKCLDYFVHGCVTKLNFCILAKPSRFTHYKFKGECSRPTFVDGNLMRLKH